MADPYATCAFCPQLCKHVCPVASATGREAASPARIMAAIRQVHRGELAADLGVRAAALCSACGACQAHCKHGVAVPRILAEFRASLAEPARVEPPGGLEGDGALVAVECDGRAWAEALAGRLGRPVARLRTADHLGEAALDQRHAAGPQLARILARFAGRTAVSGCSRCQAMLAAAGQPRRWLDEVVAPTWAGPVFACHGERAHPGVPIPGAPACCGGHGPLPQVHPGLARELARDTASRLPPGAVAVVDAICRNSLRAAGAQVSDPIDQLLASR